MTPFSAEPRQQRLCLFVGLAVEDAARLCLVGVYPNQTDGAPIGSASTRTSIGAGDSTVTSTSIRAERPDFVNAGLCPALQHGSRGWHHRGWCQRSRQPSSPATGVPASRHASRASLGRACGRTRSAVGSCHRTRRHPAQAAPRLGWGVQAAGGCPRYRARADVVPEHLACDLIPPARSGRSDRRSGGRAGDRGPWRGPGRRQTANRPVRAGREPPRWSAGAGAGR